MRLGAGDQGHRAGFEVVVVTVSLDHDDIARLHLARAYLALDRVEEPEALLAAVLARFPDHVEAGQLLARLYADQARWARVSEVLEPLLAFRHDYATNHLLAEAAYHRELFDEARGYYLEAIRLNPGFAGDHYQLANLHLAQGRFALAAESYERAAGFGIAEPMLHFQLASAYFNLRNNFGRITEVEVASGEAGRIHGELYLLEPVPGQPQRFRAAARNSAIYHAALAVERGLEATADVAWLIANIYLSGHRYEEAYTRYRALEAGIAEEERALFLYYVAQAALGLGKDAEYVEALQEAVRLDPDAYGSSLVEAYVTVAERADQAGDREQRVRFLERAVGESPETASLHLLLASAYADAGNYRAAVAQWDMVLALEPDHPRRTELLQRIDEHR